MRDIKNIEHAISMLATRAREGRISRRRFMEGAMAAGLTISAASALWSSKVEAATPKNGGHFRVGVHDGNTTDTLDPGKYQSICEIQLAHAHRSYLTEITSENGLGPDMADSWSAGDDAAVWTFQLNKDATFHDGRKFTAKDAIASLNHHRGDTSSAAAPLLSSVTDIKADGDHTIVIELDQGLADMPWIMTDYHLVMCPAKDDGTLDWESGIGAGPYRMTRRDPGVQIELERHDAWHRKGAYFDTVEMTVLNDPNAREAALVTGDVDAVTSLDLKTLNLLRRNQNVEIDNVPSGSAITLPMFCDVAPFDNVDVRLALKYAINRPELVEKILYGTGTIGNDYHVSPNMPYYPDLPQRPYDLDKAKFHLKKAGHSRLDVNLSAADSVLPGAVDLVVLYSEQAKGANINITPVREPNDGYWSNVWLVKPFVLVKWGARPTPDTMFTLAYKAGAEWNESHWDNKRFNELLLLAKKELNQEKRAEMYREMCELAKDDGGTIIPMFTNFVYGRRNNVQHGPSLAASWELDGARAYQRWWFA
jgi:peptide/nickel transport system substrate-binding protein